MKAIFLVKQKTEEKTYFSLYTIIMTDGRNIELT